VLQGIQIGELLVEQGVLTPRQVEHILKVQKTVGRPFGDLAERLYGIDSKAVEDAWVQQYIRLAGTVDLRQQEIDVDCLRHLNKRQAWQFHTLPMFEKDDQLHMATSADELIRALNFTTRKFGEPVHFLIAERTQLREFLMKHYPVPSHLAYYAEKL
jgi:hypothetical protein